MIVLVLVSVLIKVIVKVSVKVIYTDTHFIEAVSRGVADDDGPRPKLSVNPTDSERYAALRRFYANGGTYTLESSTLVRQIQIAENPNNNKYNHGH